MKKKAKKDPNISAEKLEESVNEKLKNLEKRLDDLPETAQMLQIPTSKRLFSVYINSKFHI